MDTRASHKVHYQFDYTCQVKDCGRRGGKLHAHHIIPVWLDPSKARDIGNLVTVCDECHRQKIHRTRFEEMKYAMEFLPLVGYAKDLDGVSRTPLLGGKPVSIEECDIVGNRQMYGLKISGDFKNFVANGIVVSSEFEPSVLEDAPRLF